MFNKDYDPYEELEELKKFAVAADMHIVQLMKNQDQMVKQINGMAEDVLRLTQINQQLLNQLGEHFGESSG